MATSVQDMRLCTIYSMEANKLNVTKGKKKGLEYHMCWMVLNWKVLKGEAGKHTGG